MFVKSNVKCLLNILNNYLTQKGIDKCAFRVYNKYIKRRKEMNKMLVLVIFSIIIAVALIAAMATVVAYNSLPMSKTPQWLEKVYEIVTFGKG